MTKEYFAAIPASTISNVEKEGFEAGLRKKQSSDNPYKAHEWQSGAWGYGRESGLEFQKLHSIRLSEDN